MSYGRLELGSGGDVDFSVWYLIALVTGIWLSMPLTGSDTELFLRKSVETAFKGRHWAS